MAPVPISLLMRAMCHAFASLSFSHSLRGGLAVERLSRHQGFLRRLSGRLGRRAFAADRTFCAGLHAAGIFRHRASGLYSPRRQDG